MAEAIIEKLCQVENAEVRKQLTDLRVIMRKAAAHKSWIRVAQALKSFELVSPEMAVAELESNTYQPGSAMHYMRKNQQLVNSIIRSVIQSEHAVLKVRLAVFSFKDSFAGKQSWDTWWPWASEALFKAEC